VRPFDLSLVAPAANESFVRAPLYSIAEKGQIFLIDLRELPKLDEIYTPLAQFAF